MFWVVCPSDGRVRPRAVYLVSGLLRSRKAADKGIGVSAHHGAAGSPAGEPRTLLVAVIGVAAIVVVALGWNAGARSLGPSIQTPSLPPARAWSDRGVDAELVQNRGSVRVEILLRSQPLLEAAAKPRHAEQLQPVPAPVTTRDVSAGPSRVTGAEKAAARDAEDSYEAAVDQLQPHADQAGSDVDAVVAQIHGVAGGSSRRRSPPRRSRLLSQPSSVGELSQLALVQAINATLNEQPLSGIGYQAVGAPAWWAADYTGGTGLSDTVPADVGVTDELPDATHPAFADVAVDNDPVLDAAIGTDNHGTHTAGVLASGDATFRGVAYGLDRLVNGDDAYQLGFARGSVPGAADPAEVTNTSFGGAASNDNVNDGDDIRTAFLGVSQAFAAGNDNTDGSPTVGNIGVTR